MTTTVELTCGSVAFWAGGRDKHPEASQQVGGVRGSWQRLEHLSEVIAQGVGVDGIGPRVLFWQHGNRFDLEGAQLMHRVEKLLGPFGRYRGFLTRSSWNLTHDVVFLREAVGDEPHLWATHHWTELDEQKHRAGLVEVKVGDTKTVLLLKSVLLYPWSAAWRLEEAKSITGAVSERIHAVDDDVVPLLGGSFNSADSHPNNPQRDWNLFARNYPDNVHHKGRQKPDGSGEWEADTTTMDHFLGRWSPAARRRLGGAGWVSLTQADNHWEPNVDSEPRKGGALKISDFLSTRSIVVPGSARTHQALAAKVHRYITATVRI